jgi:tRNA(fMet)-specific endonuclease VapC
MKYLLDTDTCIFFLKNKFGIGKKVQNVGIDNCYLSEITIAELNFGAVKSSNFEKHSNEFQKLEVLFSIISIYNSFDEYANERFRLQKEGNLIPDFDLLIGVTATVNNLILVTNNEKHLNRINNVQIENWTKPIFNEFIKP